VGIRPRLWFRLWWILALLWWVLFPLLWWLWRWLCSSSVHSTTGQRASSDRTTGQLLALLPQSRRLLSTCQKVSRRLVAGCPSANCTIKKDNRKNMWTISLLEAHANCAREHWVSIVPLSNSSLRNSIWLRRV